jgi:hypothetical protein
MLVYSRGRVHANDDERQSRGLYETIARSNELHRRVVVVVVVVVVVARNRNFTPLAAARREDKDDED